MDGDGERLDGVRCEMRREVSEDGQRRERVLSVLDDSDQSGLCEGWLRNYKYMIILLINYIQVGQLIFI